MLHILVFVQKQSKFYSYRVVFCICNSGMYNTSSENQVLKQSVSVSNLEVLKWSNSWLLNSDLLRGYNTKRVTDSVDLNYYFQLRPIFVRDNTFATLLCDGIFSLTGQNLFFAGRV